MRVESMPTRGVTVEQATIELHGRPIRYRRAGPTHGAPVVVLVHGMAGSSEMWIDTMRVLGASCTVIAPDLLGHGGSAKFRADYSLGSQASLLRDLLAVLGVERATFVGQSLGGGIVLQTSYQYPELCERVVLVDAGGLGRDVSVLLRILALPGSGHLLAAVTSPPVRAASGALRGLLRRVGFHLGPEEEQMYRAYSSLADPKTRKAFLATLRAVVDHSGQRVSALDRLYLAEGVPTLVVWGDHDRIIPLSHAHDVREVLPGARLEVFEGAGHFPQNRDPIGFANVVHEFICTTEPAHLDARAVAGTAHLGGAARLAGAAGA